MTLQNGFEANVYAAEPMMTQPMAFCWDSKGRIWIAENRDYESRQSGFANDGNSRILILEDTDGDGASLVINDPLGPRAAWDEAVAWHASGTAGGSPGADDPTNQQIPE